MLPLTVLPISLPRNSCHILAIPLTNLRLTTPVSHLTSHCAASMKRSAASTCAFVKDGVAWIADAIVDAVRDPQTNVWRAAWREACIPPGRPSREASPCRSCNSA